MLLSQKKQKKQKKKKNTKEQQQNKTKEKQLIIPPIYITGGDVTRQLLCMINRSGLHPLPYCHHS